MFSVTVSHHHPPFPTSGDTWCCQFLSLLVVMQCNLLWFFTFSTTNLGFKISQVKLLLFPLLSVFLIFAVVISSPNLCSYILCLKIYLHCHFSEFIGEHGVWTGSPKLDFCLKVESILLGLVRLVDTTDDS